jgi:uncharacterized delta-60 repeat protein
MSLDVGFVVQHTATQRDGKVLAVGNKYGEFAVSRFNADGTLDLDFGNDGDGIATVRFATGRFANRVAVQPDGQILVGGVADEHASLDDVSNGSMLAIARFDRDGSPDYAFGSGGKITLLAGRRFESALTEMTVQSDGKIVVAAADHRAAPNGETEAVMLIVRLNPDGSIDCTFGSLTPEELRDRPRPASHLGRNSAARKRASQRTAICARL